MRRLSVLLLSAMIAIPSAYAGQAAVLPLVDLGRALFFDVNLSKQRSQSCATCHVPEAGFVDNRGNAARGAVSLGDDGIALGIRNTPTLSYIALNPDFHLDGNGDYRGGFFLDGRAANLSAQAEGPLVNPIEMALRDADMLKERILENDLYAASIREHFGPQSIRDSHLLHQAVGDAIAAFERTEQFAPFDSKYDRYLRGEYTLTPEEELGRTLLFSSLVNCNNCHQLNRSRQETFTNYTYHNIGVPVNSLVESHGTGALPDPGLLNNPAVNDPAQKGKFRVPTLRNVAVTAPYMHNGVFTNLRTVLLFYNQYIIAATDNPETGEPWGPPETAENISDDLLKQGQPMSERHINGLLAFLKALTDRRYEHLLAR